MLRTVTGVQSVFGVGRGRRFGMACVLCLVMSQVAKAHDNLGNTGCEDLLVPQIGQLLDRVELFVKIEEIRSKATSDARLPEMIRSYLAAEIEGTYEPDDYDFLAFVLRYGSLEQVQAYVSGMSEEMVSTDLIINPGRGRTSIVLWAARHADADQFRVLGSVMLLPWGATDPNGRNAAHFAAIRGNWRILRQLHKAGSTLLTAYDQKGYAPIHYAILNSHASTARFLVQAPDGPGVALSVKTERGAPLMRFIRSPSASQRKTLDAILAVSEGPNPATPD